MRRLACVAVLAVLVWTAGSAGAAELEFVEPDTVALEGEPKSFDVWLRNTGSKTVKPRFSLVGAEKDGRLLTKDRATLKVLDDAEKLTPVPKDLSGFGVAQYKLRIRGPSVGHGLTAQIVAAGTNPNDLAWATSDPGRGAATIVAPAALDLKVTAKADGPRGVSEAIISALIIAAALCGGIAYRHRKHLCERLPSPHVDYNTGFASTATAAGGLFVAITGASVLPDETVNISKEGIVALSLVFTLLIAVGGLVYARSEQTERGTDEEPVTFGYVKWFVAASFFTIWASIGQLLTAWALIAELGVDEGFDGTALIVLYALLAIALVVLITYSWTRSHRIIMGPQAPASATTEAEKTPTRERITAVKAAEAAYLGVTRANADEGARAAAAAAVAAVEAMPVPQRRRLPLL